MALEKQYDVVILGAGLAGLSLCRQLLLNGCDKKILLLDNHAELPGKKQKVGESLVQGAGYYFARILDLEEHLLQEHYPKYNLRFHWKTHGKDNLSLEDYGVSYIRTTSNVGTYQLDRNKIERELLKLNLQSSNVTLCAPITALHAEISENGRHQVGFKFNGDESQVEAEWVVDSTGRGQALKRTQDLAAASPIRHGASWCWVEGLVNIERLTDLPPKEIRARRDRLKMGLFPTWLATNHFCGEGFWFWVIPLHGITSLGVVYDKALFPAERVSTPQKLLQWTCEEFPLFERDLPKRRIVDSARLADYAYDCGQTISASKWAMSGMSGRFSDPLYSPGSDLIAYYNTMIVDAITEKDPYELRKKCMLYEPLMKVLYDAYVPSYAVSYDVLGDQEVFTLKYTWELAVYFIFYVFPFINDLFTNTRFIPAYFRKFAQLGPINRNLQKFLSDYYQWKKGLGPALAPVANDFKELSTLFMAEGNYYRLVSSLEEAEEFLSTYLGHFKEFARFIIAYVCSNVLQDQRILMNQSFVSSIRLLNIKFDLEEIRQSYTSHAGCAEKYPWNLDPLVMEKFRAVPSMMRPQKTAAASSPEKVMSDAMVGAAVKVRR